MQQNRLNIAGSLAIAIDNVEKSIGQLVEHLSLLASFVVLVYCVAFVPFIYFVGHSHFNKQQEWSALVWFFLQQFQLNTGQLSKSERKEENPNLTVPKREKRGCID